MSLKLEKIETNLKEIQEVLDTEFIPHFKEVLSNACQRKLSLNITFDFNSLEQLRENQNIALATIQENSFWLYFYRGIARYLTQPEQRELFIDIIGNISKFNEIYLVFQFTSDNYSHIIFRKDTLIYFINPKNKKLLPGQIYENIKYELDEFFDYEQFIEDSEEKHDQLKDVDTGSTVETLRNISKLENSMEILEKYFTIGRGLWKPSKLQQNAIEKCKKEIPKTEKIIKSYCVTKINVKFIHQERIFVLTDTHFWTFKMEKDEVSKNHTKSYKIEEIVLMDIGRFVEKIGKAQKKKDGYGLAIYTTEEIQKDDIHLVSSIKEKNSQTITSFKDVKRHASLLIKGKKSKSEAVIMPSNSSRPDISTLRIHYFGAASSVYQSEDQYCKF